MNLVIVESPAKAKTIERYLGKGYKVAATVGHVMDLPKSSLGVDTEKGYKPEYEVMKGKKKVISQLRKLVPQKDGDVFLALDPDREGEAIAAHVVEVLKLKDPKRIVFNEITEEAIKEAIKNAGDVNKDLVEAQKARRILDRLVGYKLSGLLWKKIWYGLSAGRVQSVATRLIVEREREIEAFIPEEFWEVLSYLAGKSGDELIAKLTKKNEKKYVPHTKDEIDDLLKLLEAADWTVSGVKVENKKQHPYPPFTTSTLQQAANKLFGYSAKRTMQLAQQLYQGIVVKGSGNIGLISYMRTDSTNLAAQAIKSIRAHIGDSYGKDFLPQKPNYYKSRSKNTQEAHEAIRPTHFDLPPNKVKDSLTDQQFKIYDLIWRRTIGCQMVPMKYDVIKVGVDADCKNSDKYLFNLEGRRVTFEGFSKVTGSRMLKEGDSFQNISSVKVGDKLDCKKIEPSQKFTKPKARYTEASLVKALEKYGIGRPSTYATIISTIQSRGYVDKDRRYLLPTDVGFVVNDFLVDYFEDIVDYEFTSEIEEDLDEIAQGKEKLVPVIDKVYVPFEKNLKDKEKSVKKEDVVILGESDVKCPVCGGKMVERLGRNGKFLSCAKFPECKGMLGPDGKDIEESIDLDKYIAPDKCEKCGGKMVLKSGKYGKFWACKNYPDCKETKPLLLKEKCPECGSNLVERKGKWGKSFIGCSGYPDCKYIKKEPKKSKKE